MPMTADQRKKRPGSNSNVGCSSRELHRTKKKSLASLQFGIHMKPHISLELDGCQTRVVAKRQQIGLSGRDLAPFSNCVPIHHNTLADVIALPKEIFALENLETVFSYEVWNNYLSQDERDFLSQFLPKGVDIEVVVQSLFGGSNFSFGNPVHKWFTLLASGDLHPDAVILRDRNLLASQKAYCSELQDYHNGMVRNLLQLKDIWEGCQDPTEFLPIIRRTSNYTVKDAFAPADEYKSQNSDPNRGGSSESLSAMENERACSSDDQGVIVTRRRELQKRRGIKQEKARSPILDASDNQKDLRPKKGEKFSNCNILVDGAKYMAYIKITKKQLEFLKSMKQPGKGIQSQSVNHILGNLDSYHVQSYAVFEEEEQKKLQEQWLQVVNTVPHAYADWRKRQAQKEHIVKLLCLDIKENTKHILQDEERPGCPQTDQKLCGGADTVLDMDEDEDNVAAFADVRNTMHHETDDGYESNNMDVVDSVDNHGMQKMDLIPSCHEDMLDMASENDAYSNEIQASYSHSPPDFPCTSNPSFVTLDRGDPQSAVRGSWQTKKLPLPSHQSTVAHQYTPDAGELSCGDLQSNLERQPQFINSESELHENGIEPRTDQGLPYGLNNQRTFSAYHNEDRNGLLLQSIFSSPELSSYKPQQKQAISHFQQTPNVMMGNARLPIQYQEPLRHPHPFEVRQKREEQYFMNQHLPNNMLDISRCTTRISLPTQEHLPPFHAQEWHANSIGVSVPLQTQSRAGEMFTQNWYSPGQQIHGGWSNPPNEALILNHSIRNEASNDESLFSVLSQCSELRSVGSYDHPLGSTGQVTPPGSFGVTGGNIARNNNGIPQMAHPHEFGSGREVAPSLLPSSMGWVNVVPQQNSSLHDPLSKPFLRSWKQ
uniref:DEUBAD domain-containing protein n=1 Tax=Kalanchoe fedtschenkoi TaxID=63787 RepID=A0A7N0TQ30_KALFE